MRLLIQVAAMQGNCGSWCARTQWERRGLQHDELAKEASDPFTMQTFNRLYPFATAVVHQTTVNHIPLST